MADSLSQRDVRLLLAVVDGKLPAHEQAAAEERLRATPAGARALAAHRRVAGALRGRGPAAPDALRRRVQAAEAPRPRRVAWLAPAGAAAALLVAAILVLPGLLAGRPSVEQAAALAARSATEPTPAMVAGRPGLLARDVDGVTFPDWGEQFGWHADGARTDKIQGRRAVTVFYTHQGHRIGYTIVSGDPLEVPANAHRMRVDGVDLAIYHDGHRTVTVFERGGHTCILAGHVIHNDTMPKLASWRANGAIRS
jgi:anti-sigma factor RsiW